MASRMVLPHNSTREQVKACDVPRFIEQMCSKTKFTHTYTHKKKRIKNNVIELGYHEDIKIDKDIRFLLRQEMKEMDWVVFHTSHSLSIPLRRPPSSLHHMLTFWKRDRIRQCEMRSAIASLMENHLQYPPDHGRTHAHTHTAGQYVHFLFRALSPTHTDVLLKGCHDNSLKFPVGQSECESLCVCVCG